MKFQSRLPKAVFRPALLCIALGAMCSGALAALPPFTFNPAGSTPALAGGQVTADNIIISDFSTVSLSGTSFAETGLLAVQSLQLNGTAVAASGLNGTYGLFVDFSGSGTISAGNPASVPVSGQFTTLTYTLYGYNGPPATFGFSGDTPTTSVPTASRIALATGSLLPGSGQSSLGTTPQSPSFNAFAGANLSFAPTSNAGTFFQSPNPFYNINVSSFINSPTQISAVSSGFANGFKITQGGGSINFASAVPEPETYALLVAGLGLVGWMARRRRR